MTLRSTPYGLVQELPCPGCGRTWALGYDPNDPAPTEALRHLLVECSTCRGLDDDPDVAATYSVHLVDDDFPMPRNRAERRAGRRR